MLGPIFIREWLTLPRGSAHYFSRTLYLGALWILLLTMWQTMVGWEYPATLGDLARFGAIAFRVLAFVQLALLFFFAALSAASAVALEKDRRTFLLILVTDLTNSEIVLGKLLGSLLQIGVLLLSSLPVLMILAILGGIDLERLLEAMLILVTTALAAGSLGSLVALWRDKTFQALAMTVLFLVLYLCLVHAGAFLISWVVDSSVLAAVAQWKTALDPFSAMMRLLDPMKYAEGEHPALYCALALFMWCVVLNGLGILMLRVWNPSGEPIMQREVVGATPVEPERIHAAPGKVRPVWANPILWREIATRAYGRRPLLVKAAYFVVLALVGYYALFELEPRQYIAAYGLVPIGILSLLLISAQSVTSITSERDLGALDLLVITDISPSEFIFGKIFGIVYNTKEYILPPLIMVFVYASRSQLARMQSSMLIDPNIQAGVCLGLAFLVVAAFTVFLGIHVALRSDNSRLAAINTLGTIFFLSVGTMVCIYLILINGRFEYQWLSFTGFIVAGIGGLWWVLSSERPSAALNLASALLPIAVFYSITNIMIGKPNTGESADPLIPLLVTGGAFSFALLAMAIPLMSEFDVAIGRASILGD